MGIDDLVALIERHRYTVTCERELQQAISSVLTTAGVSFSSEVKLSARDRLDLLVGTVGLELKTGSYTTAILGQISRYMMRPELTGLVLVTTLRRHRMPIELHGKPLRVALARGA